MLLISHLQDHKNPYSLVILPVLNLLYWFVTWSWGRDLNKNLGQCNLHSPQQQLCDAGIFHRLYPRLQHERSWKVAVKVRQISALKVLKRLVCVGFEVFMTYTHAMFWVTEVCVRVFYEIRLLFLRKESIDIGFSWYSWNGAGERGGDNSNVTISALNKCKIFPEIVNKLVAGFVGISSWFGNWQYPSQTLFGLVT